MYYEIDGVGESLVLIPGFASGAWSWSWQTGPLSGEFRVITFDPRGIANSRLTDGSSVSIESIAGDIEQLLDKLGIDSAHILGISFGGFVAQEFALRFPDRVRRLVLASTSFGGPNHVAPAMEVLAAFASTDGLNSADRIRKYLSVAFTPGFDDKIIDQFCALRGQNFVPRDVYLQQLQSALQFNLEGQLKNIAAETLVITGDADVVVPPQNSTNLADKIPNARLHILEGAGHMAFVERAEEFNRAVADFLRDGGN